MVATEVNAFIAALEPPGGSDELDSYVEAATEALNLNSDADLARRMGVPPATFASWKRRCKFPAEQVRWFQRSFPLAVFDTWRSTMPAVSTGTAAPALYAIQRHYGAKLQEDAAAIEDAARAIGGLMYLVVLFWASKFGDLSGEPRFASSKAMMDDALLGALQWRASFPGGV